MARKNVPFCSWVITNFQKSLAVPTWDMSERHCYSGKAMSATLLYINSPELPSADTKNFFSAYLGEKLGWVRRARPDN